MPKSTYITHSCDRDAGLETEPFERDGVMDETERSKERSADVTALVYIATDSITETEQYGSI